jgi:hypothetical protein
MIEEQIEKLRTLQQSFDYMATAMQGLLQVEDVANMQAITDEEIINTLNTVWDDDTI